MFLNMIAELRGVVPKLPISYAKTLIQRAYADIRRQNMWSFQMYESNWIAPDLISGTTTSITQGVVTVTVDAASATKINNSIKTYNPINQRQFRTGISTICSIVAWDNVNTLTLDRGFPDPVFTQTTPYQIYQVYYPAPFPDHLVFISVRDMVNFTDLILDKNRIWLDEQDPQRTWYYFPTHVVPYMLGVDPNNTATYGVPMFELWGIPQTNRAYQIYGIRKGAELVRNTDILPAAITEECVTAMAKMYAFEWALANSGNLPRNQVPDWKFLMGETSARYTNILRALRRQDREIIDNWFKVRRSSLYGKTWAQYNSISGTAYPGMWLG